MTENGTAILRSSTPSLLEEADNEEAERLLRYNRYFSVVFISIILVIGIPGNILTIIVLRRRHLKDNFMSLLLTWLAVSNLSVMFVNASRRFLLGVFDIEFRLLSTATCNGHRVLSFVCITMSNWLLILVTACRALHIADAHRTLAICKPWLLHAIVIGMYGVFVTYRTFTLPPIQYAQNTTCQSNESVGLKMVSVVLLCYLPGTILVALNAAMHYTVRMQVGQSVINRTKFNVSQYLVRLILLANVLFFICTIPYAVYYPLSGRVFGVTREGKARNKLALNVAISALYLSPAINFLIYCCFGGRFRREVLRSLEPLFGRCFSIGPSVGEMSTKTHTYTTEMPREGKYMPQVESKRKVTSALGLTGEAVEGGPGDLPILRLRSDRRLTEESHFYLSELHESTTESKPESKEEDMMIDATVV